MTIEIVSYDPRWPAQFGAAAGEMRRALGEVAIRIDHIGATAISGLAAKPVIDIQISVASLDPLGAFKEPLRRLGYVYRADNIERTKRYFREPPGTARTHVHVRRWGSFSEQFALLFRDYLRAHPADTAAYEALKRTLAKRHRHDRHAYAESKVPFFWDTIQRADAWAQTHDWTPPPSDA